MYDCGARGNYMNAFDIILLIIWIGVGLLGFCRGLISQLAGLFTTLIAIIFAYLLTDKLAPIISQLLPIFDSGDQNWLQILTIDRLMYSLATFFLIFIIVKWSLRFAFGYLNRLANLPFVSFFNFYGGFILAFLQVFLLSIVLVYILQVTPVNNVQTAIRDSSLAQFILTITPDLTEEMRSLLLNK